MLNALLGWHCRTTLGCKFDTIVFAESIAANTAGYAVTITSAQDGVEKKNKLTGHNFIITSLYSVCTTGVVDAKVLPDNDSSAKFYLQPYQPLSKTLQVPLLLLTDLVIEFDNNEAHINNAYIAFDGFWIMEDKLPSLTLLSELIPTTLTNIDMQTLEISNILAAMAEAEGIAIPEYEYPRPQDAFQEFCKRGRDF